MFAKVKKEMPAYLVIATLLFVVKIATDYKGFYPITWAIMILATAISMYVIVTIAFAILKLMWSLIRRIPRRNTSAFLLLIVFISALSVSGVAEAKKGEAIKQLQSMPR